MIFTDWNFLAGNQHENETECWFYKHTITTTKLLYFQWKGREKEKEEEVEKGKRQREKNVAEKYWIITKTTIGYEWYGSSQEE